MSNRSFKITAAGKDARAVQDTAIPTDYRRLLALIEDKTHFNIIRGRLREFPDQLLEEWLAELEELGFIETLPEDADADLDFTDLFSGKPAEYALARAFLDDLLAVTGLGKERLFPVPGNHDRLEILGVHIA